MPIHYGRGGGVTGVTSWVALWIVGWCSMPLHCGRGCGVVRVTSWGALLTEHPPGVNIAQLPILCAPAVAACTRVVAEEVGSLDSPLGRSCALRTGAPCPCATAEVVESLGSPLRCPCGLRCCVYAAATPALP